MCGVSQHLNVAAVLQTLGKLGIEKTADDIVSIASHLQAWHKGRGILVSAFVDGLIAACKVLGAGNGTLVLATTTPTEKMEEWTRVLEEEEALEGSGRTAGSRSKLMPASRSTTDLAKVPHTANTASRKTAGLNAAGLRLLSCLSTPLHSPH